MARASNDADVSIALPKIPYGGFSPVRLQGRCFSLPVPTHPSRRSVCLRPSCSPLSSSDPRSVPGDVARWSTSVRAASAALPQGPRSGPGSSVPLHPHLSGPIRPTRRHIPISPLGGLYQMPSLCTLRLGDLPVVPSFHCPSFLTCCPLRLRGDRNRLVPVMRCRHRPSPCYEWLGSPDYPAIRFTQGRHFGASWCLCRGAWNALWCEQSPAD